MKRILIALIAVTMAVAPLTAQSKINKRDIQKATDEVAALYQLNEDQKQKVYEIQERRLENLAQVETLKTTDYDAYLRKRRAVQIGTDNAIKRLLDAPQLEIFQTLSVKRRERETAKMIELKKQGASKEEIERALLEIE